MQRLQELTTLANKQTEERNKQAKLTRAFINSVDHPMWMKSEQGVMVLLNQAYEREFKVPVGFYEGRTDFDVWPRDIAEIYWNNDLKALKANAPTKIFEPVPVDPDAPEMGNRLLYIEKTPLVINGLKYIKGESFDVTHLERIIKKAQALHPEFF